MNLMTLWAAAHIKLEPGDQAGELGVTEEDSGLNDLAREMTRRSQQAASQHIPSGEAAIIRVRARFFWGIWIPCTELVIRLPAIRLFHGQFNRS